MRRVGILIAVERYRDATISVVRYAENDARELSSALNSHGFESHDQVVLLNADATKSTIESRVRKCIDGLDQDDVLYLYYAGHGFAKSTSNYITCYDTDPSDLANTSVSVKWIFDRLHQSKCAKVVLFLDSCESGMFVDPNVRGIYTDLTEDELVEFFNKAQHRVCFAACKPGQESHSADGLKHGIWTHHLLQALCGNAPESLINNVRLTSSSLQNYLAQAVPRTLRTTGHGTRLQTPWFYGAQSSEFQIADLAAILEARKIAANPQVQQLKAVILRRDEHLAIKKLSGFSKSSGHFVPEAASTAANSFVGRISEQELNDDLQRAHDRIRTHFALKRVDMEVQAVEDGYGTVVTPHFDYAVSIRQDDKEPSEAILCREIINIRNPEQVFSEDFDAAFPNTFALQEFQTSSSVDVKAIIDRIEALDDDQISVQYDPECSYCRISVTGLDAKISVTAHSFQLERFATGSPRKLIEGFFEAQKLLIDQHQIKALPFSRETSK